MIELERHCEVGPAPHHKPVYPYFLNGEKVGTRVSDVMKSIPGAPGHIVKEACKRAREDGGQIGLKQSYDGTAMRWIII
jgi:hypothetical protein